MMNLAFAGFRHSHIFTLWQMAKENNNVHIIGCFEEDAQAKSAAQSQGVAFNISCYEEILNCADIDAIAIGDYYGKRGQMIIAALKAGKHVICDKPLCTSLVELYEIESLVHKTGLQVSCMLDLRYTAQVKPLQTLLADGTLGELKSITFTGQHCLDYGVRPNWYFEDGKHGGTINDIAIHGVDLVRLLSKKDLTGVNCAKTYNAYADKEPHFKDSAQFLADFDGCSVMADVSYAAPKCNTMLPTYWEFTLWCTKGMARFRLADNKLCVYTDKESIIDCPPGTPDYLNDFYNACHSKMNLMDTLDILKTQRQVLEIQAKAE